MSWTIGPRLVYRNRVASQRPRGLSKRKNMKRLLHVALLPLVVVSVAQAQDNRTSPAQANSNVAADFASTTAATASPTTSEAWLWPSARQRFSNVSSLAEPAVPVEPSGAVPAA